MSYPYHSTRRGGGGRGFDGTPPLSSFFETILASVERLRSSQQVEAYFMGGDAAGSL